MILRKMFYNLNCKLCLLARIASFTKCARTKCQSNYTMEEALSLQESGDAKQSYARHYKKTKTVEKNDSYTNILEDTSVLYVGRILTTSQNDIKKSVHRNNAENFQRISIPFSSRLLENSFNSTVSQKRNSSHLSGGSSQKVARKEQEEVYEDDNETDTKGPGYGIRRHWELTSLGAQQLHKPVHGFEFFVMSYNILAQNLLEDNVHLYRESDQQVLDWKNRSRKLLMEIKSLKAEILCLQEVNQTHYDEFLEPELRQLGYRGVYVKRTGDKMDGCATFYLADKFTLVESVSVPYYKSNHSLLDRDNVGLIVKLKPHKHHCCEEDHICVANTHLLFNPRRGDIKLAQVICLIAELNRVAKTNRNNTCQIIMCGDFNATPFSDLYKFLVQGYLRYEGLLTRTISGQKEGKYGRDNYLPRNFFPLEYKISDQCQYIQPQDIQYLHRLHQGENLGHHSSPRISQSSGCLWHRLNLVSTYRHTIERLGHREREVTTQHSADNCTVDYIFYSVLDKDVHTRRNKHRTSNVTEGKLKLLARWGLMSSQEIGELGNLPNHHHPSDHLPLLVKMILI